jgi:thiamine-phosphate pyrophosphorylase
VRLSPLYAIVDADVCAGVGLLPVDVAVDFADAGVSHVQLRAKSLTGAALLDLADRITAALAPLGATLIVNDRVDVAAAVGAGVHLGQHDLPVSAARRLLGPDAVIGRSTHTPVELARALAEPVSYVAYGPVFATATKADPDPVVGLDGVAAAARAARAAGRPLVAIGGITLETAAAVTAAGADAVAVISDLVRGPETPRARTGRFLSALRAESV